MNRLHSYSIQIDFGGVKWLIEELKSAAYNFNATFKPKKYQASYALFVMERYANKNGNFIRLVELRKGTTMNTVIFPAGIKGNGWRGIVASLQRILSGPPKGEKNVNRKEVVRNDQQVSSGRMVVSRLSYAEIVKNYELNKEDFMRGKQPADTMNVRGAIEWKRVVVCSRESVWDSWRCIQNSLNKFYKTNFQLKPFLIDKAMFICNSEEEAEMYGKKAEDKLDADDLEYESSSFAEDVSSIGTIVEESQEELSRDLLYSHFNPEEQSEKAIMEVIQGHATVNAMWPVVLGKHGGTLQDHSLLSLKEISTGDYETANKFHEEEELDAVSHRGEEDGIRKGTRSRGGNTRRMSNLTKFKWVQRPSQVYSKRKMKGKVTLNAGDEMEGTSNGKVMEDKGGSEARIRKFSKGGL
ncbi:hypothetical protein LguiB_020668 [Lonicera macranthoides]